MTIDNILNVLWKIRKGQSFNGIRTKDGYSTELRMCLIDFKDKFTDNQIDRLKALICTRNENSLFLVAKIILKIAESGAIVEGGN